MAGVRPWQQTRKAEWKVNDQMTRFVDNDTQAAFMKLHWSPTLIRQRRKGWLMLNLLTTLYLQFGPFRVVDHGSVCRLAIWTVLKVSVLSPTVVSMVYWKEPQPGFVLFEFLTVRFSLQIDPGAPWRLTFLIFNALIPYFAMLWAGKHFSY